MRTYALTALLLWGALIGLALCQDPPSKLPIWTPKDASVDFEVDAPGSELMPLIRHYLSSDTDHANITVKTGAGDVKLKASDVENILKQIQELHVVAYSGSKETNPIGHHETDLAAEGMRKVARIGGSQEVLVMVRRRSRGQYAFVLKKGGHVTVVRTEGVPDLGELTQVLLEGVASVAQSAIQAKTQHHP